MKFSITALLLLTFVVSVVVAIFSNQQQHPKQVLHVLRNLKHVSPYAGTKDVCELLVVPFRPADYKHLEKPIYYVEIDFDYRLAIEFEAEADGVGREFRSARVLCFNETTKEWLTIYPIREKFVLVEESGRRISCTSDE